MTLTAVSLFAGIEGFGLGLHRAGVPTVAAVEIDPAARGVIADRMSDTALFTDVCEVTADDLRAAGFVPEHGIITAGWPCTDLSVAGHRLGLAGARSGLFWEVVRIIDSLRPRWFVLENVPGLLSAVCPCPGRDDSICGGPCADGPHQMPGGACGPGRCMELHGGAMGAVVGALEGLRYGLAWRVLDAQHFGVPQRRRRVIFVGCLGDGAAPVEVLLEPEGGRGDSAAGRTARTGAAAVAALGASGGGADDNDATGGRLIAGTLGSKQGGSRTTDLDGHGAYIPVVGPLQAQGSDGRGHRVDAEGATNGHLVAATLTAGSHSSNAPGRRREDDVNLVGTVSAKWAKGTGGPAGDEAQNLVATTVTGRQGRRTDSDATDTLIAFDAAQITHPENRTNPQPGDPAMPLAATGQPHVAYALRADPGGTGQGHNTTYAYQCHGSNVGPAGTLRAGNGGVRRLTPVECERLQGFPDGWTATSWGKPQSDSARYRELGNAVAVPVIEWVARRIAAVDARLSTGGSR